MMYHTTNSTTVKHFLSHLAAVESLTLTCVKVNRHIKEKRQNKTPGVASRGFATSIGVGEKESMPSMGTLPNRETKTDIASAIHGPVVFPTGLNV